ASTPRSARSSAPPSISAAPSPASTASASPRPSTWPGSSPPRSSSGRSASSGSGTHASYSTPARSSDRSRLSTADRLWSPASAATIPRTARETLTYGYVYRHPAIRIRKVGVVGIAGRVCSGRCAHTPLLVLFDHPAAIIIPGDVADPPRAHRLVPRARMNELRDRHMRRIVATVTVLGRV